MLGTEEGEKKVELLLALLRGGNYVDTACAAAGLSPSAFYSWRERGELDVENDVDSPYAEFAEAVVRARATGEATLVQEIRAAAQGTEKRAGDWKAAAFLLERGHAERWAQRKEVTHRGGAGRRTEAPEIPETDDRLLAVVAMLGEIGVVTGAVGDVVSTNGASGNGHV